MCLCSQRCSRCVTAAEGGARAEVRCLWSTLSRGLFRQHVSVFLNAQEMVPVLFLRRAE